MVLFIYSLGLLNFWSADVAGSCKRKKIHKGHPRFAVSGLLLNKALVRELKIVKDHEGNGLYILFLSIQRADTFLLALRRLASNPRLPFVDQIQNWVRIFWAVTLLILLVSMTIGSN